VSASTARPAGPLFRRPVEDRITYARTFVGRMVRVDVDVSRDGDTFARFGRMIAAARMVSGTTADVVVLQVGPGESTAIPGAQIRAIVAVDG
jgi:hypothetical protein